MENRHDLKISGMGTSSGGFYNNVVISGTARINGDLDCIDLNIEGVCKISGNVKAKNIDINGENKLNGNLECDELKVNGHSKINGNAVVKDIYISGATNIGGNISAENVSIQGAIKVDGNCDSENFISKGVFNISGLLNSGNVEVELYGKCKAKEIGGEKISIKKGISSIFSKLIKPIFDILDIYDGLIVELIEGDDIYLEHTKAKVVRGNNIRIGSNCEIDLVEYTNTFEQLGDAKVIENRKI